MEEAKTLTEENEKANKGVPLAPVDPKFMLGYYVNDPQFPEDEAGKPMDVTRKGTINLLDVNVVDISPKTAVSDTLFGSLKSGSSLEKEDLENMIVFKVTVSSGRRYTLAAPEADAIEWICYFTWFSNAWRSADKPSCVRNSTAEKLRSSSSRAPSVTAKVWTSVLLERSSASTSATCRSASSRNCASRAASVAASVAGSSVSRRASQRCKETVSFSHGHESCRGTRHYSCPLIMR